MRKVLYFLGLCLALIFSLAIFIVPHTLAIQLNWNSTWTIITGIILLLPMLSSFLLGLYVVLKLIAEYRWEHVNKK